MKVLVLAPEYFFEDALREFRELGQVDVKNLSRQDLLSVAHEYEVFAIRVDTKVNKELLDASTNLKLLVSATTGLDHIDTEELKRKEIGLVSLQGANTTPTAEHVFALLFSLFRKVPSAHNNLLSGNWERHKFIGTNVAGKTLGIVGFGRIGQHVATIAQGLGMDVIAYDPYVPEDVFRNLDVQKLTLDLVLKSADVVTSHMLLTPETRGMFNSSRFALMKQNAVLINCSRGGIVVEGDLIQALKNKDISGAALDTYDNEPIGLSHPYVQFAKENPNLVLTPHIGGSTVESIRDAGLYVSQRAVAHFKK
jgi:D-3-phosphoglycerate dehydrogenase / 2-oxoglutarate reductase